MELNTREVKVLSFLRKKNTVTKLKHVDMLRKLQGANVDSSRCLADTNRCKAKKRGPKSVWGTILEQLAKAQRQ